MSLFWASAIRDRYADENIATAQAAGAKANERATTLENQTADLQRRTAEANLKAEQERLARLKIEERLAGRSVSSADAQNITVALKQFAGTPIDIFVTGGGVPETDNLANTIFAILASANWKPMGWTWTGIGAVSGVVIFTKPGSDNEVLAAANALAASLSIAGIVSISTPWPGEWATFSGMLNGPVFDAGRSSIRTAIGSKPAQ